MLLVLLILLVLWLLVQLVLLVLVLLLKQVLYGAEDGAGGHGRSAGGGVAAIVKRTRWAAVGALRVVGRGRRVE